MREAFLSRSRVETFQLCPRRGYFEYLFAGIGLSVDPGAVFFDTGNAVHSGLAACLSFIKNGATEPTKEIVSQIVLAVLQEFDRRAGQVGIERLSPHVQNLELNYRAEQRVLSVAIVYVWIVTQWIQFAARFEVVTVELDTHFANHVGGLTINWESKADAIVRERATPHRIRLISWKTAADTREWTRRRYRSDLQGFLECWFAWRHTGIVVDFNNVIYLVKGKKLRLDATGVELPWNADVNEIHRYATDSFLITPYLKPDHAKTPFFNLIEGLLENTIWSPTYRQPGNLSDSRFNNWTRPSHWKLDDLDSEGWPLLFTWIDALAANRVFPTLEFVGDAPPPLDRIVVWEDDSPRNDWLTEQLIKEITFATYRYSTHGQLGDGPDSPDVIFSRNLRACHDGPPDAQGRTGCPYRDLCMGPSQIIPTSELLNPRTDPAPPGFVWRKPHHVCELAYLATQFSQ